MLLWRTLNEGENMKAITLEMLLAKRELLNDKSNTQCAYLDGKKYLIDELIENCKEIDMLTPKETDLILAEKYAEKYSAEDGDYIKTNVLNAFYHGAKLSKENK